MAPVMGNLIAWRQSHAADDSRPAPPAWNDTQSSPPAAPATAHRQGTPRKCKRRRPASLWAAGRTPPVTEPKQTADRETPHRMGAARGQENEQRLRLALSHRSRSGAV